MLDLATVSQQAAKLHICFKTQAVWTYYTTLGEFDQVSIDSRVGAVWGQIRLLSDACTPTYQIATILMIYFDLTQGANCVSDPGGW